MLTLPTRDLEDQPEYMRIDDQKPSIRDEYDGEHYFVGERVDDIDGYWGEETHAEHDDMEASCYVGEGNFVVVLAIHTLLL